MTTMVRAGPDERQEVAGMSNTQLVEELVAVSYRLRALRKLLGRYEAEVARREVRRQVEAGSQ